MILTLGKHPREEHCLMIEKVPVIMAWLPTTAAIMAITSTGHLSFSGPTDLHKFRERSILDFTNSSTLEVRVKQAYQVQKHRIRYGSNFEYDDAEKDMQLAPCMQGSTKDTQWK